jgi:hypothetical protein
MDDNYNTFIGGRNDIEKGSNNSFHLHKEEQYLRVQT